MKFLTAQHSVVCSWEEYSSWEMKNPSKKNKINKEVAGKSAAASAEGGNWAPPWQPTW